MDCRSTARLIAVSAALTAGLAGPAAAAARCSFVFVASTGARTATLRAAYAGDAIHGSSTASRTVAVRP
jgi:hypothetical protein